MASKLFTWLHYIPLVILALLIFNGVAHLFKYHVVHGIFFNIVLFITLFLGLALLDQAIHAIEKMF